MGLIEKYRLQILFILSLLLICLVLFFTSSRKNEITEELNEITWWEVQSIDTVKYSRDLAREKLNDPSFTKVAEKQVKAIAKTGATHISIGTPYDDEFIPFLKLWVNTARKYGLNVWFRGNFSGWEGWFGYPSISKEEHIQKTERFIILNSDIFDDGDVFTSCTECENGQLGDPRYGVSVEVYRNFLIDEYRIVKDAFTSIGKSVDSNYYSMNGDVARHVMDKETTETLNGIVVVDHYVGSVEQLSEDITALAKSSGGNVVLGEFGAPIPNIHGSMSEEQQAEWIRQALFELSKVENLIGVNYWTSYGGSTQLWDSSGTRKAVSEVSNYYSPEVITTSVVNELGKPIRSAEIIAGIKIERVNKNGEINILIVPSIQFIEVKAEGYEDRTLSVEELINLTDIVLKKERESILFKLQKLFV